LPPPAAFCAGTRGCFRASSGSPGRRRSRRRRTPLGGLAVACRRPATPPRGRPRRGSQAPDPTRSRPRRPAPADRGRRSAGGRSPRTCY